MAKITRRKIRYERSPMAIGSDWAARIMTISLEMVLPGLVGVWVDGLLGTMIVFTLAGFALGITAAIYHLIHLTKSDESGTSEKLHSNRSRLQKPSETENKNR